MTAPPPPGWYPDQQDPRYVRWWDGRGWSHQVQPAQPQPPQPPQAPPQPPPHAQPQPHNAFPQQPHAQPHHPQHPHPHNGDANDLEFAVGGTGTASQIQQQAQRGTNAGPVSGGGGTLFTEPVLVVNQKAKLIEMANEYAIYDQHGRPLGSVVQVGQSGAQKALRMLTKADAMMTTRLEIRDTSGRPVLHMTRPATLWKSTVEIVRGDGAPVGSIRQENAFGKVRFAFEVGGQRVGSIFKRKMIGWDFGITDGYDREIANITKTFEGVAKAMFSTADNYVVHINQRLNDPLASMVVASALTVDTVVNQQQS